MRLALFSDIHSNHMAMEACLQYADHVGVDGYIFLGDHLTDCPYPQKTLALMRQAQTAKPTWMLRGNREDYLIKHHAHPNECWTKGSLTGSLLYTYEHLTNSDIAFLQAMPISQKLLLPDLPPILIAHAAPNNNNVLFYPGSETLEKILRTIPESVFVTGHSHFQFRYESHGKQCINPGAVGMPTHGQMKAQFALLTCLGGRWSVRMLNVDYDRDAEIRLFEESGLLEMSGVWGRATIKTLREGGRWAVDCLNDARKLAPAGEAPTEVQWESAAVQLGIL